MSLLLQASKVGGPLYTLNVSTPVPSEGEVLIRIKAVALNPIDWKQLQSGVNIASWPATFGNEASGVVEQVGSGVWHIIKGDEVLARFEPTVASSAAFRAELLSQTSAVIKANQVSLKPSTMSFEEAASIPMGFMTAASTIHYGPGIPLLSLTPLDPNEDIPSSVLVLGGSSAVGSAAIQLLRLALPPATTIISTSSSKHHRHLKSLGATAMVDHKSPEVVREIFHLSPDGQGVDAIVDVVNGVASDPSLLQTLTGSKSFVELATGLNVKDVPPDVRHVVTIGRKVMSAPGAAGLFPALTLLLRNRNYKLPLPVTAVSIGLGLGGISQGLEMLRKGVSGTKLVVTTGVIIAKYFSDKLPKSRSFTDLNALARPGASSDLIKIVRADYSDVFDMRLALEAFKKYPRPAED